MMHARSTLIASGLLSVWLLVGTSLAPAQDTQYREQEVLDPNTLTWAPASQPTAAPAGPLDEARHLLATGKPGKARGLLKDWLDANFDSDQYYEGEFLLGETYFLQNDFWKAVERFQTVAENASGALFERANERCVDVARAFLAGRKRILWKIFRLPAQDDAIEILDRVWERMPGTRLGETALWLKAQYFFRSGQMDLAQDEYANLVTQYPGGRYTQIAMLRSAEAAEASFPGIRFDDRPLLEARERYEQLEAAFPAFAADEQVAARLEGIEEQRANKDLDIARWYQRTDRTDAAIFYYRTLLRDWPDTLAAAEARRSLEALGAAEEPPTTVPEGES